MTNNRPPQTPRVTVATLATVVNEDMRTAMQTNRDANAIIKRAGQITAPPDAAQKAEEAKQAAELVGPKVAAVRTAWESFLSKTDVAAAQVDVASVKAGTTDAGEHLKDAQELIAEAEKLARSSEDEKAEIERLKGEATQLREAAGRAEDAVKETAKKIKAIDKTASTPATQAAVTAVQTLQTNVGTDYTNARAAEDAAKAATTLTDVQAAHTAAQNAKDAAEAKVLAASDELRKIEGVEPPPSPPRTPKTVAKEWVRQRIVPIGVFVAALILIVISLIVIGAPAQITILVALLVFALAAWALYKPPAAATRTAFAALIGAGLLFGLSVTVLPDVGRGVSVGHATAQPTVHAKVDKPLDATSVPVKP